MLFISRGFFLLVIAISIPGICAQGTAAAAAEDDEEEDYGDAGRDREMLNETAAAAENRDKEDNGEGDTYNRSIHFVEPDGGVCAEMTLRSELALLKVWKLWVNGIVTMIVALFGLTGNCISIFVMSQPKMKNSFNQLLIALCVFDSMFIACNILNSMPSLGIPMKEGIVNDISRFFDVIGHVSMCASVLMIVAFTFERHFAIRSPHQYRIHIRTTPGWKHLSYYIVPVTFLSLFFNIPMFINLQRSWMSNPLYVKINLWLRIIHPLTTTGIAPILILVLLNVRICKGIMLLHHRRTNRNAKEIKMTYIAIAIVTLFVVSNMPRILLGFEEVVNTKTIIDCIEKDVQYIPSLTFFKVDSVARLLMIVNSSVNFLVYCAGSTAFQDVFLLKCVPLACRTRCLRNPAGNANAEDDDDDDDDDDEVVDDRRNKTLTTRIDEDPLEEVGEAQKEKRGEKLATGDDNTKQQQHDDEGFAELQVLDRNDEKSVNKNKSVTRISLKRMLKNRGDVNNV